MCKLLVIANVSYSGRGLSMKSKIEKIKINGSHILLLDKKTAIKLGVNKREKEIQSIID